MPCATKRCPENNCEGNRFSHIHRMARQDGLIPAECPMLWSAKLPLWNGKNYNTLRIPVPSVKDSKTTAGRDRTKTEEARVQQQRYAGWKDSPGSASILPLSGLLSQHGFRSRVLQRVFTLDSITRISLSWHERLRKCWWSALGSAALPKGPAAHCQSVRSNNRRPESAGYRDWLSAHRRWFYFFQITKSL